MSLLASRSFIYACMLCVVISAKPKFHKGVGGAAQGVRLDTKVLTQHTTPLLARKLAVVSRCVIRNGFPFSSPSDETG